MGELQSAGDVSLHSVRTRLQTETSEKRTDMTDSSLRAVEAEVKRLGIRLKMSSLYEEAGRLAFQ